MNGASILQPSVIPRKAYARRAEFFSPSFYVSLATIVATILKLFIAWNTIGTNDSIVFFFFGRELASRGLVETYQRLILFNHPPLVAYYLHAIYQFSQSPFCQVNHISFPFLLRLPGIVADAVSVIVVCELASHFRRLPLWALLLFALNPISIMVSGYHGNTDSIMVMLLLLACLMTVQGQGILAGLFLALSCQIKTAPALFLPAFLLFWRKSGQPPRFTLAFCGTTLLLILQPLIFAPVAWAQNVLSYGSYSGLWGITYLLHLSSFNSFSRISFFNLSALADGVNVALKLAIVTSSFVIAWQRRHAEDAVAFINTLALTLVALFILAPGIAPQYFVWLCPFLLLLSPPWFACFGAAASIFLFIFYNTISHGLPWYFGVSTNALSSRWAAWSLLPWLTLIAGLAAILRSGSYRKRNYLASSARAC